MDSISHVDKGDSHQVVVSASHGGVSSGEYATRYLLAAVFFNDAGVGKNNAGIAALAMLDQIGVPAGTVSHQTARIGDAADMWENGVLSHLNDHGRGVGMRSGEPLKDAVGRILDGNL